MRILDVCNPLLVADILVEAFKKMNDEEFLRTLNGTKIRGDEFARTDDSDFCGQLNEQDATEYANLCRAFHDALQRLNALPSSKAALFQLASVIAWWQTISTFRTMFRGEPLEKI